VLHEGMGVQKIKQYPIDRWKCSSARHSFSANPMQIRVELFKQFLGIDQDGIGLHSPRVADKTKADLTYSADRFSGGFDIQRNETKGAVWQRREVSEFVQRVPSNLSSTLPFNRGHVDDIVTNVDHNFAVLNVNLHLH
jgi:hypothetical protein